MSTRSFMVLITMFLFILAIFSLPTTIATQSINDSVIYIQSTPLQDEPPSGTSEYTGAFVFSGVVHCNEMNCAGVKELRIQSNPFGPDVKMKFARVDQLIIRDGTTSTIIFKQSYDNEMLFDDNNQFVVQLVKPTDIETQSTSTSSNSNSSTELIIEFRITVLETPKIPTSTWFGQVNVVLTTVLTDGSDKSVYQLVDLHYFTNLATEIITPFKVEAILSHTNTELVPPASNDSNNNRQPTILFSSFWTAFPFSFESVPIIQSSTTSSTSTIPQDDTPTKSLSYLLYQITGPFEFVINPDQTTIDIPCLMNDIDVVSFQITPTTILFFFSDYIKSHTFPGDSISLICPKYMITTRYLGVQDFYPGNPSVGISAYFFVTNDSDANIPDEYFTPSNAQYAHSLVVPILVDRSLTPYSLTNKVIVESDFVYTKTSVLYQDYFNLTIPGTTYPNSVTFNSLNSHLIGLTLMNGVFTSDISTYFNNMDLLKSLSDPWVKQIKTELSTNPHGNTQYVLPLAELLGNKNVTSFYYESFFNTKATQNHTNYQNNQPERTSTDIYPISTYSLTSPRTDSGSTYLWQLRQVPYTRYFKYDPLTVDGITLHKHPYFDKGAFEFTLNHFALESANHLEVTTPRTQLLRFNGPFKCDFAQLADKKKTITEQSTQNNNIITTSSLQHPSFQAYPGVYNPHSNQTTIVNQTIIHFRFEGTTFKLLKTQSYHVKCSGGTMDMFFGKEFSTTQEAEGLKNGFSADFMSFRVNVEGKSANITPNNEITINTPTYYDESYTDDDTSLPTVYQTSAIYFKVKSEGVSNVFVILFVLFFVTIAGSFFVYISHPKTKEQPSPQNGDIDTAKKGDGSYNAPLLPTYDGTVAVIYDDAPVVG